MSFWTVFYLISTITSLASVLPFAFLYKRKNNIEEKKPFLSLFFALFIPVLNLFLVSIFFKFYFTNQLEKRKTDKKLESSPHLSSLSMLETIQTLYKEKPDDFSDFSKRLSQTFQFISNNQDKQNLSFLLIRYEYTFANIIAIIEESQKINNEMATQFLTESLPIMELFLKEVISVQEKKEKIEKESVDAIRKRFSQELRNEHLFHQKNKDNTLTAAEVFQETH